jgi:lipoprotein-anchoring transpeptidase ErfK/SrfK
MRSLLILCLWALPAMARDLGQKPGSSVPTDKTTILRVQIFLDQMLFTPGKIDGSMGEFTYKAVVNYNFAHGIKDVYDWSAVVTAAQAAVPQPTAQHRVKRELLKFINPDLPEKPADWEGQRYMAYRSMVELIAERFHTDEDYLQRINPKLKVDHLAPDDVIIVPNVKAFKIEDVKKDESFKSDPLLSTNIVVIDTTERMGAIYDAAEKMLAAFPITPGKPQFIPRGQWTVKTMIATPEFRYDKQFLEQGTRGDAAFEIPPGPNNPVGMIWCGLSKSGIGLHGTASPRTIGRAQSAGCVRFANWDAIRLPALIRPGSTVIVR